MFKGTIPEEARRIVVEGVRHWGVGTVAVGCSGNFTIERSVYKEPGIERILSNDVSLYTSAIGFYLSGQPVAIEPNPESPLPWLAEYMTDDISKLACVFLASSMLDALAADGTPKKNPHYRRIYKAYTDGFQDLHARTIEKLKRVDLRIDSYFCGDVMVYVDEIPEDAAFVSFPPFYVGGYTAMFKKMDLLFSWTPPTFSELDDDLLSVLYHKIKDRPYWMVGTDTQQPELEDLLVGVTHLTNASFPYYFYASQGKKRIVMPHQQLEAVNADRLMPGEEIGSKMTLAVLNSRQFAMLRAEYLNADIKPGSESAAFAVLVDGKLVGVFAISISPSPALASDPFSMYVLSDFPVRPTDYPRLSKLVLCAALSKEARMLFERTASRRIKQISTTAFTNAQSSMKYRGLMKVWNRKENPQAKTDPRVKKFFINYYSPAGRWTLDEGLAYWKKKFGVRDSNGNADDMD